MRKQLFVLSFSAMGLWACSPNTADTGSSGSGGSVSTNGSGGSNSAGSGGSTGTGGGSTTGSGGATSSGSGGATSSGSGGATSGGSGGATSGSGGATTGSGGRTGGSGGSAGATSGTGGSPGTGGMAGGGMAGRAGTGGATPTGGAIGGGPCGLEDCESVACTKTFTVPTSAQLKANAKLPDPFTFFDGTKVMTKADWACRHKEISMLAQEFIYGRKPGKPESVTATYTAGKLAVTVTNAGKSINFTVNISGNGTGPVPAIFSVGSAAPSGVATIDFAAVGEQLAKSNGSQGRIAPSGLFYTLYPDYKTTGSLMVWAWGASRILDALEKTTGHNIDLKKISALGCSRNGKEAGMIGLFDDRIALVAAQSPGSGLSSGWRVAQGEAAGSVQTASEIYGEDTWMGDGFQPFGNSNVTKLPVDQHEVISLAWPRPVIIMEGSQDSWNCPRCEYMTMKYVQMVFTALGNTDYVGFPQPPHGHCAQAGTFAIDYYNAFVNRFLKGMSVTTANMFTDTNFTFDMAKWQDGPIPTLN